jgi:transcription-repair coupling factor (superfamily II helicase)
LESLEASWRDQYGRPPDAVEHLLTCAAMKLTAAAKGITAIDIKEGKLMLTRKGGYVLVGGKFARLTAPDPPLLLRESLHLLRSF